MKIKTNCLSKLRISVIFILFCLLVWCETIPCVLDWAVALLLLQKNFFYHGLLSPSFPLLVFWKPLQLPVGQSDALCFGLISSICSRKCFPYKCLSIALFGNFSNNSCDILEGVGNALLNGCCIIIYILRPIYTLQKFEVWRNPSEIQWENIYLSILISKCL